MSRTRKAMAGRLATGFALLFAVAYFPGRTEAQTGKPYALRCEALVTPVGMDARHPRLSWKLQDAREGARQTVYELQVASNPKSLESGQSDV